MSDPPPRRGLCLVLSAPSGAGKSSLARALLQAEPNLALSISVTTRPPRPTERDGIDYFFRTDAEFAAMQKTGALLESATVFGRGYGTPRGPVEHALATGRDLVFDIDWQGHRALRARLPGDTVGVFILPPSLDTLQHRLATRGDTDGQIAARMDQALAEMSHWREFDHVIVNEAFDHALATLRAILAAARTATTRQVWLDSNRLPATNPQKPASGSSR